MLRVRSFSYILGAILIIFSLYTLLSLSRTSDPEVLQTPNAPTHDAPYYHDGKIDAGGNYVEGGFKEKPNDIENKPETTTIPVSAPAHPTPKPLQSKGNSIDHLINEADTRFKEVMSTEIHSLEDAAATYRKRRGRHPPPGFDLWFQYAKENDAVIVEDFWDQIYHDLNPFWAIVPGMLRTQARALGMGVEIKGGKVVKTADWFWHETWGKMIDTFAQHLPDMFVSMNPMDESRLLVRWEKITEYMDRANREKAMPDPSNVIGKVKGWDLQGKDTNFEPLVANWENWNGFNPYNYARRACPPTSHARQVSSVLSPTEILAYHEMSNPPVNVTQYFDQRFVTNYTEASDFCNDASIGGLHGSLMLPLTCKNSDVLMPMFGGSKFHVNNEILLPPPMYWKGEDRFGGDGGDPMAWQQKQNIAMWRGAATGGRNKPFNWWMFHRHRFVAMTNGTRYAHADKKGRDLIFNELLLETGIKTLNKEIQDDFADWLITSHDVGFMDLVCDEPEPDNSCWFTKDEFDQIEGVEFMENLAVKYLPDVDGNSFSGRYRAFLLSNSLPIKATIYREWHDSRLMAWKHFVPMNNRYSDYYSILEHFMGNVKRGIAGRDDQAEKIAIEGAEWGAKVLRKIDMQIYVFRLLLEYGRLTDDNRHKLGWVEDLTGKSKHLHSTYEGGSDPYTAKEVTEDISNKPGAHLAPNVTTGGLHGKLEGH